MKKRILLGFIVAVFGLNFIEAQDIPQSEVPSPILNKFQQDYPKARDIEWEFKGDYYEVEFEIGRRPDRDHEIWYDTKGKELRHKAEISKKELPQKVLDKLDTAYQSYRIKDVEKITRNGNTVYSLEAKSHKEEWELKLDENGKILSKKPD